MKVSRYFIVICASLLIADNLFASRNIGDSIVKIYAVQDRPSYVTPWNKSGPAQFTGSGCIIKGRKILTNAHVVSDSTFIQIRLNGQANRLTAHVESISHTADLAILAIENPEALTNRAALDFGELPAVQQEISVYGFPIGGDTMSITRGVVSRIEHQTYTHSGLLLLAAQIDAPINPGNSGGPAIVDGKIAGIAMMSIPSASANSIGYLIPPPVLRHFLKDVEDGRLDDVPLMGYSLQQVENPDLKSSLHMGPGQDGVLIIKVKPGSSAAGIFQPGDVITHIDGWPVAGDGTVEFRKGERTHVALLAQQHQMGEEIKVEYLRDGKPMSRVVTLKDRLGAGFLVPRERYDVMPTYFLYGGLVFCPLTIDLLKAWGDNWMKDAPNNLLSLIDIANEDAGRDEVVVLLRVLPADLNQGYQDVSSAIITKIDGRAIRSLRDLIGAIEGGTNQFVVFGDDKGHGVVLNREHVKMEQAAILKTYQIPFDRSGDLRVK